MSDIRIKLIIPNVPTTPKEGMIVQEEGGEEDGSVWRHNGKAWMKIYPRDDSDIIKDRLRLVEEALRDLLSVLANPDLHRR